MEKEELIPSQQIGQQTDASEEKIFSSSKEARAAYPAMTDRLLNVNAWHTISKIEASCFQLFDKKGTIVKRPAREGDYIRINIPGPGTEEGKGYDWVCIEYMESFSDMKSDIDFTLFVARPTHVPGLEGGHTAHFFTDRATSTFMVFRRGNVIHAEVHGRNEVPNTQVPGFLDQARNLLVNAGSAVGMSFAQWHLLISGILTDQEGQV